LNVKLVVWTATAGLYRPENTSWARN